MRKLNEITGEESFSVLETLMDVAAVVTSNPDMKLFNNAEEAMNLTGSKTIAWMNKMLKGYKEEVCKIIATLDNVDVDEYKKNLNALQLKKDFFELMNDMDVISLFL